MKKIVLSIFAIVLFFGFGFGYSDGCVTEESTLGIATFTKNNCMDDCALDNQINNTNENCNMECDNEIDNLAIAQESYNTCMAQPDEEEGNEGETPGGGAGTGDEGAGGETPGGGAGTGDEGAGTGTQCTTNDDCGPNAMCVDSQENPGEKTCITNTEGTMGITMNADCLINGQCSYNIYETLGIRKSDPDPSVTTFVQDIVLGLTMFIGTVVSVILVVSGVLYIMAGIQGNSTLADTAKKGIVNSLIGLLLVVASYSIVRLIQFLATAGGG